jgi:serine/threonine protein kinase
MSNVMEIRGDITPEALKAILEAALPNTPIKIGVEGDAKEQELTISVKVDTGSAKEAAGENTELAAMEKKLKQSEATANKALSSIQTFHKQQKALFDEFVLLRQRYDDMKVSLLDVLWVHCSMHHPDLRQIPDLEDSSTFVINEDKVGRYDVGEVLGEGQFATVKSCYMEFDDAELALKIINKDQIASFVALRRVSNEIGTLKKLQSSHIVRVTDVFQTKQHLYIVTEKGGLDLFAFFDEHPDGVSEKWAKEIITAICRAVFFCHSRGICHRDLKPENILLDFDLGKEKCVDLKLCDFGLSTSYQTSSANVLLNDFCGSPGFFAPEMITVGQYYGDRVDVWSIGCILLELVLGHQKFCDLWMTAYDYEIMQDKDRFKEEIAISVQNISSESSEFSEFMQNFILRVLDLDPEKRATAREISQHPWFEGALQSAVFEEKAFNPVPVMMMNDTNDKVIDTTAGMSNRERRLIQQYAHTNGDGVSLPPIEPATPSLRGARKILKSGEKLATQAASGNWDARSPQALRLDSFDSPMGSPMENSLMRMQISEEEEGPSHPHETKIMPGGRFGRAVSVDVSISESLEDGSDGH